MKVPAKAFLELMSLPYLIINFPQSLVTNEPYKALYKFPNHSIRSGCFRGTMMLSMIPGFS